MAEWLIYGIVMFKSCSFMKGFDEQQKKSNEEDFLGN